MRAGSGTILPVKKIILLAVICSALGGAAVAAVSEGPFGGGWLAAGGLLAAAVLGLGLAWRWAGGGRSLALLLAVSFTLRLGIGILMSLGLQAYGYNEIVQRSGYVYADAFSRDDEAWKLAVSDKPLWASFQQEFLSDQYGGSLALSALVYRALSPDAHRRFLILILTAFAFSIGLPFFWKAVRQRWNEPLAQLSAWILVLYPESVLVGASQMREPFLLGLGMIGLWAMLAWNRQRLAATLTFAAASGVMLAFSSRAAVIVIGALLVCGWLEWVDEIRSRRWQGLGWAALGLAALALALTSWNWLQLATSYDAGLAVRQSGMVTKLFEQVGESLRLPFITVYGLAQPVLPAALVDPAPLIWKTIAILRAGGWYLLAPVLLYAAVVSWRALPARDRRLLAWLGLGSLLWILLCSLRAGGDQWDNPRYRVLFLPFMAVLAAWGWRWSRAQKDAWIWAWLGADGVFVAFFLLWYLSRYTGAIGKLPFWLMVGLILAASALVMLAGWAWSVRRRGQSIWGELRAAGPRLRAWLALRGAGQAPPTARLAGLLGSAGRFNRWDGAVLLFFAAFALLYLLGRLQGNFPVIILSGDAGNIASFAAAQAHPELFRGDPVLGEAGLTGFYATIHVPLIKALAPLAGGDFAWAYTWLVAPHILLQLLGFYILGRQLLRSRYWALLLALLTAMPYLDVGVGEFWGIWRDALPRVSFQTALPYLLALAVAWRSRPARWPWLMILAGLMVFLHSISAPAWGLAIWLGLWLYHPAEWKWPRRLGVMLGLGLLFLLALAPFMLIFFSYQQRGASSDYDLIMLVINTFQPKNILNIPAALGDFLWAATRSLLLPLALLGGAALWRWGRGERRLVVLALLWAAGIFSAAVLLPAVERVVESALRIPPVDTELVRDMRYLVPLLLLFWLWPLAELGPRLANPRAGLAALALGGLLLTGWTATHTPEGRKLLDAAACLARGRLVCGETRDSAGLITALREQTPPGARIFNFNADDASTSNMLSIRYAALRPLVFTPRDAGLFIYADRGAYPAWLEVAREVDAIQALSDPAARLERLAALAARQRADYLVVDFALPEKPPAGLAPVWQNKTFSLFKVK